VAKKKLLKKRPLGIYAIAAQTSPDGKELYILGATKNAILIFDTSNMLKVDEVELPTPFSILYRPIKCAQRCYHNMNNGAW